MQVDRAEKLPLLSHRLRLRAQALPPELDMLSRLAAALQPRLRVARVPAALVLSNLPAALAPIRGAR
jgi:hypothetical protein